MEKVKFKQMKEGSKEDYILLNKLEKKFIEGTANRVLKAIQGLTSSVLLDIKLIALNIHCKQQLEL